MEFSLFYQRWIQMTTSVMTDMYAFDMTDMYAMKIAQINCG